MKQSNKIELINVILVLKNKFLEIINLHGFLFLLSKNELISQINGIVKLLLSRCTR